MKARPSYLLAILLPMAVAVNAQQPQVLPAGTEVKLAFAQSLSSDHAVQGERVELRVAEDVTLGDRVVVCAGTRALGTVTVGKKDERYGFGPGLAVTLDYIVAPGRRIPLTGQGEWKRTGDIGRDVGSAIVFGVGGFLMSRDRRVARVEEGTIAIGFTADDVAVLDDALPDAQAPPPWEDGAPLS